MHQYKRLMVGISFGDNDESTIRYAAMLSRLARSEKVYFAHVVRSFDKLATMHTPDSRSFEPVDEFMKHRMKKIVTQSFDGHRDTKAEYEVVEGSRLLELLRLAKLKEIDLIVIGKGRDPKEEVKFPVKLTRKAPCSILVVPKGTEPKASNILVPVDFSDNSADAMKRGVGFASALGMPDLKCLHVYYVPTAFHITGKSYEKDAGIMKRHVETSYQEFINKIDCRGISVIPIFTLGDTIVKTINETIEQNQIDFVVVGARGRHRFAGLLLGSTTRGLIKTTSIPLYAVKKKGPGMSFLETLVNS
jgi:nucleotide-binding universal stress UspA family protein